MAFIGFSSSIRVSRMCYLYEGFFDLNVHYGEEQFYSLALKIMLLKTIILNIVNLFPINFNQCKSP